jgi:hypothetical protein
MYKKGRLPRRNFNGEKYVASVVKPMRPFIKQKLKSHKSSFINSRELDDELCDDMKNETTLIDGEHRWIEIHRNMRVRIIITTLIKEFGYIMWSGKTKKVLYKPQTVSFKRASELRELEVK